MATPESQRPRTHLKRKEAGTRALLDELLDGDEQQTLDFNTLMQGLGRRAFGMLLLLATLPAFIPIPIGGVLSGPLVVLLAAQLFIGLRTPWLPGFIARRGPNGKRLDASNASLRLGCYGWNALCVHGWLACLTIGWLAPSPGSCCCCWACCYPCRSRSPTTYWAG